MSDEKAFSLLTHIRETRGDTLQHAADAMGVGWLTARRIEERVGDPRLSTVLRAAEYYNVPVRDLVRWLERSTEAEPKEGQIEEAIE